MNRLRLLLFPFSLIFFLVTEARNYLYSRGILRSFHFDVFTVCVGNLTVGGTGKTPMTEYLIRSFCSGWKIATLSRGYGRKTKGYRMASQKDNPMTIGDEPFQLFTKFRDRILVTVSESRVLAIPEILMSQPDTNLVLLDDAFQHRRIKCDVSILLCDYNRPFYDDFLLPAGNLRESSLHASRADIVVVTKCPPTLNEADYAELTGRVQQYAGQDKPVFFTQIRYDAPRMFDGANLMENRVMLVSGLADANPLEAYVKEKFDMVRHENFKDHYAYSERDIKIMELAARDLGCKILTTEKDYVKISQFPIEKEVWAYLPIKTEFLSNEARFLEIVKASYLARYGV